MHNASMPISLLAIITAVVLFVQAYHPRWQGHLQVDVVLHHLQSLYFQQQGTFSGVMMNEYQPGAYWFFLVPHLLASLSTSFDAYRAATIFTNASLLIAHGWLYWRFGPSKSVYALLSIVLAAGPILLYRFDLIVSLLVLSSWLLHMRKRTLSAVFLVGLATAIKLYPAALLPFMIAPALHQRSWQHLGLLAAVAMIGLALPIAPFLLFAGTPADIAASFEAQQIKPVGLDSAWGTLLTVTRYGTSPTYHFAIDSAHGIHGFTAPTTILPLQFYNWAWIIPVGITLFASAPRAGRPPTANPLIPLLTLTVFTMTQKVINPQYLWWFASLFPLVIWQNRARRNSALMLLLLGLIATQAVYPMYYSNFIAWFQRAPFQGNEPAGWLVGTAVLRNVLLAALLMLLIKEALRQKLLKPPPYKQVLTLWRHSPPQPETRRAHVPATT